MSPHGQRGQRHDSAHGADPQQKRWVNTLPDEQPLASILRTTFTDAPMLRKLTSVWLVFLTLTPFTAPYPTCDLTIFLTGRTATAAHTTSQASLADASLSQTVPLFRAAARARFVAFAETRRGAIAPPLDAASVVQRIDFNSVAPHHHDLTVLRI